MNMDEMVRDMTQRLAANRLSQFAAWYYSPLQVAAREESRRKWLARPWHERAWIRTKARVRIARERLGEWVAGRSFDD